MRSGKTIQEIGQVIEDADNLLANLEDAIEEAKDAAVTLRDTSEDLDYDNDESGQVLDAAHKAQEIEEDVWGKADAVELDINYAEGIINEVTQTIDLLVVFVARETKLLDSVYEARDRALDMREELDQYSIHNQN